MSNNFKLCPTHFSRRGEKFQGYLVPPAPLLVRGLGGSPPDQQKLAKLEIQHNLNQVTQLNSGWQIHRPVLSNRFLPWKEFGRDKKFGKVDTSSKLLTAIRCTPSTKFLNTTYTEATQQQW